MDLESLEARTYHMQTELPPLPSPRLALTDVSQAPRRRSRRIRQPNISTRHEIPETKDCDFVKIDVPLLLRLCRTDSVTLLAFSKRRYTFALKITWDLQNESSSHVCLSVQHVIIEEDFNVQTDDDFVNLVKMALKKIWFVHPCKHCEMLLFSNEEVCEQCQKLSVLTYGNRECVICKESEHPILFRCVNCVDSEICVRCEHKRELQHCCVICRRPDSRNQAVM